MISRLKDDPNVRMVALVWLSSRIFIYLFLLLGQMVMRSTPHPWPSEQVGSWVGVPNYWLNPLTLYDTQHYLDIAKTGYIATAPKRAVFFPLYPLAVRLLSGMSSNDDLLALAGAVISNLSFAGALWLLFCLTRDEWGETVARRAVWIEAFFPVAAFSAVVYTESLFLLLSIAFFWMARKKKWWICGVCGLLAGLTRNSGPILVLALLLDRPKMPLTVREKWDRALCAITPLIGFITVQFVLASQYGAQMNSTSMQRAYGRVPTLPWVPLWMDIKHLFSDPTTVFDFLTLPSILAIFGTFGLIILYARRFSPGKLLYLGAVIIASLSLAWLGQIHTISTLRYLFGVFPAAQLLALFSVDKALSKRATLYIATAGLLLFFIHSYLIGYKNFMG